MKKILSFCLLLLVFNSSFAATAEQRLGNLLSGYTALSAEFVQKVMKANGIVKLSTRGRMSLKRPHQFYWQTYRPNAQLLVTNDQYLWVYNRDLRQATRQKINHKRPNNAAALLSGSISELNRRFKISAIPKHHDWYLLKPRYYGSGFQWAQLAFAKGKLSRLIIKNSLGQMLDIQFSHVVLNPKLPASLFNFRPPYGVEVVYSNG